MSLKCAIVGLPNVGKSTLFNALTASGAETANYPFCTIDPNMGVVPVPDPRLDQIAKKIKPQQTLPARMEFVDVAGLIKGASLGEGLGNQFLGHIRETQAIVQVVRCFANSSIIHVSGSVDPLRDMEVIHTELLLSDLESLEKRKSKMEKQIRTSKDKKQKKQWELILQTIELLNQGQAARHLEVDEDSLHLFKELQLLSAKPILYVSNLNEEDFAKGGNSWSQSVQTQAQKEGHQSLQICSALESEIALLTPSEQQEFLDSICVKEPALHRLIQKSYSLLGLQTYFTAGPKEVRAWTIPKGCKAPQAASVIHTDFAKGFIRAEVYNCQDLFQLGSPQAVKEAGKLHVEGKDYVVKDGDILFFRFNN